MNKSWQVALLSFPPGRNCPISHTAATGSQHRTMWPSVTWSRWTEMFTLRTSGCRWRPNSGEKSTIATGLLSRWRTDWRRHLPVKRCLLLVGSSALRWPAPQSAGGHHADVCGGDDRAARSSSLPPGTLHRGQVHQIQLQLGLCEGRQHQTDSAGECVRGRGARLAFCC